MKCIISPVSRASVYIEEISVTRSIEKGLLVYVGISKHDTEDSLRKISDKILQMKLFHSASSGKIDANIKDISGEILCISNFTLYGDCSKGTKIDFGKSATFEDAKKLYDLFCKYLQELGVCVKTGEFGAYMIVESSNDGPLNYIFEF